MEGRVKGLLAARPKGGGIAGCTVFAVAMTLAPLGAHAQAAQTAEGAQQFLAAMAKKGLARVRFVDAVGRSNYVTGKYTAYIERTKFGLTSLFSDKGKETREDLPEQFIEKQMEDFGASELAAMDANGNADVCTTRIAGVVPRGPYDDYNGNTWSESGAMSATSATKTERWTYEPITKFAGSPHFIDWSDAKVDRGLDGTSITVTAKGQVFATNQLVFVSGDADLVDRIEYALKFLKMSCDQSMDTGF